MIFTIITLPIVKSTQLAEFNENGLTTSSDLKTIKFSDDLYDQSVFFKDHNETKVLLNAFFQSSLLEDDKKISILEDICESYFQIPVVRDDDENDLDNFVSIFNNDQKFQSAMEAMPQLASIQRVLIRIVRASTGRSEFFFENLWLYFTSALEALSNNGEWEPYSLYNLENNEADENEVYEFNQYIALFGKLAPKYANIGKDLFQKYCMFFTSYNEFIKFVYSHKQDGIESYTEGLLAIMPKMLNDLLTLIIDRATEENPGLDVSASLDVNNMIFS